MDILLETEHLRLRRFTLADADHLFALDNDPEVMRYLNGGTPVSRAAIEEEILPGFMRVDMVNPAFGFWAAEGIGTGEFVGWFSLRPLEERETAVLGYRLVKKVWGRGYATEGVRALIRKGFNEMGIRRVVATTYEENVASRRVMEKVGMTLVRRFRLTADDLASSDTFHTETVEVWDGDDVEYALEKSTWEQSTL
ncbi:MAG: GNAT family acetyltransferase [Ardenticatenaceae bacterium]|nr:MAG: GNAT family acetyltransferase [Ardenticatenaceae bacterium]